MLTESSIYVCPGYSPKIITLVQQEAYFNLCYRCFAPFSVNSSRNAEMRLGMDQKYHDEVVNLLHPDSDIAAAMSRILISSIMFRNVNVCSEITAIFSQWR